MEYRFLGKSGLKVPVLSFGTATFGGADNFSKWGETQVSEATKLVNMCLDAGINLFDTADVYSQGLSEEILGKAILGKRNELLLSTKSSFTFGQEINNQGSSRYRIIRQVESSLRRLNTDYIDIYHMHGFDGNTSVDETLRALDDMVTAGKIRYIAASNFSGWHLMKSLAVAEKYGWNNYVAHQVYYSLLHREYEWELMPLAIDQNIGAIVWSALSGGRLGGKYRRNQPLPEQSRVALGGSPVPQHLVDDESFYSLIDTLDQIAAETGKSMAQIAINWVLQRPTVSTIIIGARNEKQLEENLGSTGWNLSIEQVRRLDMVSAKNPIYPYWHQQQNLELNPIPDMYRSLT